MSIWVFNIKLVLAECCPKHLKFTSQVFFSLIFNWFWRNAVPNISCVQCFSFCCAGSTLNTFEHLHACTSQKAFGKCKCWNFAENIWMETMFWIFGGPISKRFAGVNMFWRCLTTGFFKEHFRYMPTYFLWNILGDISKKNGNTMAPVRCCKNQIEFLWSIATRCLPEDVLLQIFGIIYIYMPEICLRNIIADICNKLLRNIWGDWPKPVLRNCFQRYLQYDQVRKIFGKHVLLTGSLGERCIHFFG